MTCPECASKRCALLAALKQLRWFRCKDCGFSLTREVRLHRQRCDAIGRKHIQDGYIQDRVLVTHHTKD